MMPTHARQARTTLRPRSPRAAGRRLAAGVLGLLLAAALGACGEGQGSTNSLTDSVKPHISLLQTGTPSDSTISFDAHATDNLGLLVIHISLSGPGINGQIDTTFNTAVTSIDLNYTVSIPSSVAPGTPITVIGTAVDGARNTSAPDTLIITTGTGGPAAVLFTTPKSGDTAVVNFSLAVSISGKTKSKVKALGFIASGVFAAPFRDSVIFASPLKDSTAVDTALSLVGANPGTLTLTPFMIDSLQRTILGPPVNLVVLASAPTNTIPVVDFGITKRIETTDTIHVSATDRSGVRWLGYEIRQMPVAGGALIAAESTIVNGNVTSALHTFNLNLPIVNFPTDVQVQAFARNTSGTRDYARTPVGNTGTIRIDTVTVVAGLTRPLPFGGTVADAIYHPPSDRLYMSNIDLNRLEVFNPATSLFETPIAVGSRPWGLAARPADRSGTMTDTLLVANSGGTLISYVDVALGNQHEVKRYPLPNIIVFTVTSTTGPGGVLIEQRTAHDFSDRPQYIAATCTGGLAPGSPCGDVVLVYTTTPTAGQSLPFVNLGTVRWENLTRFSSHFFFEQAIGQTQGQADTLEIDRFAAGGVGSDSTLVPFRQGPFIAGSDTAFFSIVVQIPRLGFRDTTFTRNSGNFRSAIVGEGGRIGGQSGVPNARVMMYDVLAGFQNCFVDKFGVTWCAITPVIDNGVSRAADVSDYVANTSASVSSVAINFDGQTGAIRADSTYLIDRTLRLQGLLQTSGGNPGIDFHPQNAGIPQPGATGGTQLMFSASDQPQIEVYNTNTYFRCQIIPTRDPIIGPIKAAVRGGSIVLVGATVHGVVVVNLPLPLPASCS